MADRLNAPNLRGPLLAGVVVAVATSAALLLWMPSKTPPLANPVSPEVEPEYEPSFAELMPESARAVTLEIEGGEWVRGQTKVDVLYARDVVATGDREATTLLRDVIALPSNGGESSVGWVTLLLGREEAERLSLARATGRISLVLRPDGSADDEAERASMTLADITNGTLRAMAKKRQALKRVASTDASPLAEGMRGVPLRTGLVLLQENERVDVVAVFPDGPKGELIARTVFLDVAVAGVQQLASGFEVSALLELLPEDAELLALANPGSVYLVLRNHREWPGEGSRRLTRKTDTNDLLDTERSLLLYKVRHPPWPEFEPDFQCVGRRRPTPPSPVSPPRLMSVRLSPGPRGGFFETNEDRFSTLAPYVDTGSFSMWRRVVEEGRLPAVEDLRSEELLNFFKWSYPAPVDGPFAVHVDGAPSPFRKDRTLLRVALQGRGGPEREREPTHLVFLVDSMHATRAVDARWITQASLRLLVGALQPNDTIAIVRDGIFDEVVLPAIPAVQREKILDAVAGLSERGSGASRDGQRRAYSLARKTAHAGEISRMVFMSDGFFLGPSPPERAALTNGVAAGVALTVIGYGRDFDDASYELEQLALRSNGSHHHVDSMFEARRVLLEQLGETVELIARDVNIEVAFDPGAVKRHRLVGYEKRAAAVEDFQDNIIDDSEIGSGHQVTALYELELVPGAKAQSLATVHVRWKEPDGVTANELTREVKRSQLASSFGVASRDLQFAAGVMGAAENLRGSAWSADRITSLVCRPGESDGDRKSFCELWKKTRLLSGDVTQQASSGQ